MFQGVIHTPAIAWACSWSLCHSRAGPALLAILAAPRNSRWAVWGKSAWSDWAMERVAPDTSSGLFMRPARESVVVARLAADHSYSYLVAKILDSAW